MEQCLLIHSTPPQGLFVIVLVKPTQSPHFKVCLVKSEGSETEGRFRHSAELMQMIAPARSRCQSGFW